MATQTSFDLDGDGDAAEAPFPPTRAAGLDRLAAFVPKAGSGYTKNRNHDLPDHPHVSQLSPYLRHRLVTEREVLAAVLERFKPSSAEKFIQEVYWRTYWKGWLEMRPSVWMQYRDGVRRGQDRLATEGGLRRDWEAACRGETGIACFDHWAHELAATGYLHNHARMWFASIWIFTLRLPWELGADFFLRHLLDGDPASNTLGWRWVAGLQTRGKNYVARASNIAKFTDGRFNPAGQLNEQAAPLDGPENPPRMDVPEGGRVAKDKATGILLHEEDLAPDLPLPEIDGPLMIVTSETDRSPLEVSPAVTEFTAGAATDAAARFEARFGEAAFASGDGRVGAVADWVRANNLAQIATPYAPVGPAADMLTALGAELREEGVEIVRPMRDYDAEAWPHATAGFFKFKEKIPRLLGSVKGLRAA